MAYYTKLNQIRVLNGSRDSGSDLFIEQIDAAIDDTHMLHCFDYLRQALMCAADTNLEHVSRKTRITTGWNSDKICRNYGKVFEWAEQWANSSDVGIM